MELNSFKIQTNKSWSYISGMDISPENVKYLLLQRKGKKLRVIRFGRHNFRNGELKSSEAVQSMFGRLFGKKTRGFQKAKMILGLDGPNLVVKKESFPNLSKKELLQTISFGIQKEAEKENQGSNFVCDYRTLGSDPDKKENVEYLTMGAPEEAVDDKVRLFVAEGIIPSKVTPSVVALANLVQFMPEVDGKQSVIVLDIGAHRSMLVFLRDGKMDFFREIMIGGEDFTRAITGTIFHEGRAIQFTPEEAIEFKFKYGYPLGFSEEMTYRGAPLSEVGAMMRPVLERLTSEIHRSIDFYREKSGGESIKALYLVGGGARLKHLSEVLAEKIGIPVSPLPVLKGLRISGGKTQRKAFKNKFLEQAVSLALALESTLEGNLLPAPYRKIQRMKLIHRGFLCGVLGIVGIMIFLTLTAHNQTRSFKKQVNEAEIRVSRITNTTQLYNSLVDQKTALEGKIKNINNQMQQDKTLIQVLRLFSHVVPRNLSLIFIRYEQEKISSRKGKKTNQKVPKKKIVEVRGMSNKPPTDVRIYVAQLIMELERSGYFSNVDLAKEMFDVEEKFYGFELLGSLKGKVKSSKQSEVNINNGT